MIATDPQYLSRAHAWRDAVGRLAYAREHGALETEIAGLARDVADSRALLLRSAVAGGWTMPDFIAMSA